MKITRNGMDIELTDQEIEQIYRERKTWYNKQDLIHKIKCYCDEHDWENEIFLPDDEIVDIGDVSISVADLQRKINDPEFMSDLELEFQDALDNNDGYWESFWMTAEYVIEEKLKEG